MMNSFTSQRLPYRWGILLSRSVVLGLLSNLFGLALISSAAPRPAAIPGPIEVAQTGIQVPVARLTPANGRVTIRFINQTGAPINYQVISDTELRTLAGESEMTLSDLPLPTSLTFRRADFGFLAVSYQADAPEGTLTITVQRTSDFASDRTSVYIDSDGLVYFN